MSRANARYRGTPAAHPAWRAGQTFLQLKGVAPRARPAGGQHTNNRPRPPRPGGNRSYVARSGADLSGPPPITTRWLAASGRLRCLGAVLGAALLPGAYATSVKGSAHDVGAYTGQVLHPASADQHDRVLLQVVAFAGDIGRDLHPI